MSKINVFVAVPAYCEEQTIGLTIKALKAMGETLVDREIVLKIYVVNDGSTDDTARQAKLAGADRVLSHRVNQGLGAAVRTGLLAAKRDGADIVIKFDADLQHEPMDIPVLIEPILNDEADIVYGNRFERIRYKMPFVRRVGNLAFTGLMRWMTKWPVRDSQPGIFAVSRAYLNVLYIPGDYNYTQQILIDAYHKGMRFAQVPVAFNERKTGTSFVSLKYPFKVLPQILRVLVGVKPLKVFGPVGLFFLMICLIVSAANISSWLAGSAGKPIQNVNLVLGSGMFGLQTIFFGLLADLIVKQHAN
jgi:glycosyltransferase involved in cell wall biosynthesis